MNDPSKRWTSPTDLFRHRFSFDSTVACVCMCEPTTPDAEKSYQMLCQFACSQKHSWCLICQRNWGYVTCIWRMLYGCFVFCGKNIIYFQSKSRMPKNRPLQWPWIASEKLPIVISLYWFIGYCKKYIPTNIGQHRECRRNFDRYRENWRFIQ